MFRGLWQQYDYDPKSRGECRVHRTNPPRPKKYRGWVLPVSYTHVDVYKRPPYANSTEFPLVGSSGRSATGGPVFRKADFKNAPRSFPDYYEGKWLAVDFMRGWIMAITMDEKGDYKSMERFMPSENFSSAIDTVSYTHLSNKKHNLHNRLIH